MECFHVEFISELFVGYWLSEIAVMLVLICACCLVQASTRSCNRSNGIAPPLKLTHVLSPMSTPRFSHLCRARPPRLHSLVARTRSLLPSQLYIDHSHYLVLAPVTLAALPSACAIPRSRGVLCRATHALHSREIAADVKTTISRPVSLAPPK